MRVLRTLNTFVLLAVVGSLTACASVQKPVTLASQDLVAPRGTFVLIEAEPRSVESEAADQSVRQALSGLGWQEAQTEVADWQVEVAYSERPLVLGVRSDGEGEQAIWDEGSIKPSLFARARQTYSLGLVIEGRAAAYGPYQIRVTQKAPRGRGLDLIPGLAQEAVLPLGQRAVPQ